MAKDEQSNQLNLTVVALVALVAIVGLVALVMNAASIPKLATGSQVVSAAQDNVLAKEVAATEAANVAGGAFQAPCIREKIANTEVIDPNGYGGSCASYKYTCRSGTTTAFRCQS